MDMKQAAQMALDVQNAVNLSGVVHSFAEVMTVISEESHRQSKGTEWKNTHPIVTAFLEKLVDLNRFHVGDSVQRNADFAEVERLARE